MRSKFVLLRGRSTHCDPSAVRAHAAITSSVPLADASVLKILELFANLAGSFAGSGKSFWPIKTFGLNWVSADLKWTISSKLFSPKNFERISLKSFPPNDLKLFYKLVKNFGNFWKFFAKFNRKNNWKMRISPIFLQSSMFHHELMKQLLWTEFITEKSRIKANALPGKVCRLVNFKFVVSNFEIFIRISKVSEIAFGELSSIHRFDYSVLQCVTECYTVLHTLPIHLISWLMSL